MRLLNMHLKNMHESHPCSNSPRSGIVLQQTNGFVDSISSSMQKSLLWVLLL
jgi:hypothetical protein